VPERRRLVAGFPRQLPEFEPRSGHVKFVVDEVALGQDLSEYFTFPCEFSFQSLLYTHYLISGAGIMGQLFADVSSRLSLTPTQETKKNRYMSTNIITTINVIAIFYVYSLYS
jgi:hypothetical protein